MFVHIYEKHFVIVFFLTENTLSMEFEPGYAVAHLVEALCYKPKGRGFNFHWWSLKFFIDLIFPGRLSL
jgi:hypothetical protein